MACLLPFLLALTLSLRALAQDQPPANDPYGPNNLTVINVTPYDFRLTGKHSYQLEGWDDAWPTTIRSGDTFTISYSTTKNGDDAGDVGYTLNVPDATKGFTLHVQGKNEVGGVTTTASYTGAFSCNGNPTGTTNFQIGDYTTGGINSLLGGGGDAFIVAGDELQGYTCNNPPTAWMSYLGTPFKTLTMRQAVMPASHDSGVSTVSGNFLGDSANTRTQVVGIYQQLVLGVRWLDWRPYTRNQIGGEIFLGHFNDCGSIIGDTGQSLDDAMADVTRFISENPGELVVIDTYDGGCSAGITDGAPEWTNDEWTTYFQAMQKGIPQLSQVYTFPDDRSAQDTTSLPLNFWFKNAAGVVLHRVPNSNPVAATLPRPPNSGPLDYYGFLQWSQIDYDGSYSNTDNTDTERADQQQKLASLRTSPNDKMFRNTFTYTQQGFEVVDGVPIIDGSTKFHALAYDSVFRWATANSYPNLIEMDAITDSALLTMCMALNIKYAYNNLPVCSDG